MVECYKVSQDSRGFTLVEISIVLLIVSLLVGGVILGRDLIHQANIRNVITQISKYNSATNVFRGKYASLPGDTSKAIAYGLADPACPAGVGPTPPVVPGCNGNGDELLTADTENTENISYWYHLSRVGMIDGQFNGLTVVFGQGAPPTKLRQKTGFYIGTSSLFTGRNIFVVGYDDTSGGTYHLMPLEAWAIDNRMDDGLPSSGTVKVPNNGSDNFAPSCYSTPPNSEYDVDNETETCALYIRAAF